MISKSLYILGILPFLACHQGYAGELSPNPWQNRATQPKVEQEIKDKQPIPNNVVQTDTEANELTNNPWFAPQKFLSQNKADISDMPYERTVPTVIPNAPQNIKRIQRGGVANIRRPQPKPAEETSFWDGLWSDKGENKPAVQSSSDEGMFDSWFKSSPSVSNSTEGYLDSIDKKYDDMKNSASKSWNEAVRSLENLGAEARNMLK